MFDIEFDRTISSELPADELWPLVKGAFENPATSPLWPVPLEEVEPIELSDGAPIAATYAVGPLKFRPRYHITDFDERGRSFRYQSDAYHPLKGGATVRVQPRQQSNSALRWTGSYRPRLHPLAPGAVVFVRLYFVRTFFANLESNLRDYEARFNAPTTGGDASSSRPDSPAES